MEPMELDDEGKGHHSMFSNVGRRGLNQQQTRSYGNGNLQRGPQVKTRTGTPGLWARSVEPNPRCSSTSSFGIVFDPGQSPQLAANGVGDGLHAGGLAKRVGTPMYSKMPGPGSTPNSRLLGFPRTNSLPAFQSPRSPFHGDLAPQSEHGVFGKSTPGRDSPAGVFQGIMNDSRPGTPLGTFRHLESETSDPSDVSEMDISQTSPCVSPLSHPTENASTLSPTWDKVRTALSNFSLFQIGATEGPRLSPATSAGGVKGREGDTTKPYFRTSTPLQPGHFGFKQADHAFVSSNMSQPPPPPDLSSSPSVASDGIQNDPSSSNAEAIKRKMLAAKAPGINAVKKIASAARDAATEVDTDTDVAPSALLSGRIGMKKIALAAKHAATDVDADTKLDPSALLSERTGRRSCCSCCLKAVMVAVLSIVVAIFLHHHDGRKVGSFTSVNTQLLRDEMASRVFGQHIAKASVPDSLRTFFESYARCNKDRNNDYDRRTSNRKDGELSQTGDSSNSEGDFCSRFPPLVLAFHGWTGVGKNFVTDIVTSAFKDRTVNKFLVPYHFPHRHRDNQYQADIPAWVAGNRSESAVNFFVFDEMDKASPGVLAGIATAISQIQDQGSNLGPSVFLLLSNSFGSEINRLVFTAMEEGQDRESLTMDDFSSVFIENNSGASWLSSIFTGDGSGDSLAGGLSKEGAKVVSVPFLPLEKGHVVQCVRRDLVTKKLSTDPETVRRVLAELSFVKPPQTGTHFSQTGCKRVADKVDLVAFG